jgi:hypothetical protein
MEWKFNFWRFKFISNSVVIFCIFNYFLSFNLTIYININLICSNTQKSKLYVLCNYNLFKSLIKHTLFNLNLEILRKAKI